jgi:DNA polymerase I
MKVRVNRREGYELLHDGLVELSLVEANGIKIDIEKLEAAKLSLESKIRKLKQDIEDSSIWREWRKLYGLKANIGSHEQLANILYNKLGYKATSFTASGKPATDEQALQSIEHPLVQDLLRLSKYEKAHGTFLKGIEKEIVQGRLHPIFNLHLARTYRSSSDSPNFQNIPVRDKEISKIIRSLFIPSSRNHVIVENDFKGIEVSVSACYHKDKNFISYITTPGKDMHRDMAAQIYCLDSSQVDKETRYGAKNKFVFPQFYGDYYISCAKALWDWIQKGNLKGPDGKSLYVHLAKKGIKKLGTCNPEESPVSGTFEHHLREVENDFWNSRFMAYGKWRREWYAKYIERGYFDMLTGFRVYGSFNRNSVVNYPVQGSAFHCLLWTLIQVNRRLRKHKMKSIVVGQIHDSLIGDILISELKDYLEIVEEVATVQLRERYKWLIVPLEIEYEIAPPGESWHNKREIKFKKGIFTHPSDNNKRTKDPYKFVAALTLCQKKEVKT